MMITTIISNNEYSLPLHLYINKHLIVQAGNPPLTPNLALFTFSRFYSRNFSTLSANDVSYVSIPASILFEETLFSTVTIAILTLY
jgi:hypothetical protein